jgi:hypothetical protein
LIPFPVQSFVDPDPFEELEFCLWMMLTGFITVLWLG